MNKGKKFLKFSDAFTPENVDDQTLKVLKVKDISNDIIDNEFDFPPPPPPIEIVTPNESVEILEHYNITVQQDKIDECKLSNANNVTNSEDTINAVIATLDALYDNREDFVLPDDTKNLSQGKSTTTISKEKLTIKKIFKSKKNRFKNYTWSSKNDKTVSKLAQKTPKEEKIHPVLSNELKEQHYVVQIRVAIFKIGEIDTLNEKFYAEVFIEASWLDKKLRTSTKYDPKVHWNPDLSIVNSVGDVKEQKWYSQHSRKDNRHMAVVDDDKYVKFNQKVEENETNDGELGCVIVERRRLHGMFSQTLNLKDFPADIQDLTLTVSTAKHSNEISITHCKDKSSTLNTNCFLDHQEWHLYKHMNVEEWSREYAFSSETFPAINITIFVARRPSYYFVNAFFLIFLITISSLTLFSMRCNLPQNRLQTGCTLLLTSVTFKWITNRSLPTVSYMTSLDKYSLGCIVFVCVQCIFHGVLGMLQPIDSKCTDIFSKIDWIAFLTFCSIFGAFNLIFILWCIKTGYWERRKLRKEEKDFTNSLIGKRATRLKSMFHGI